MEYTVETWGARALEESRAGRQVMAAALCPLCNYRLRTGPHDRGFPRVRDCACEPPEYVTRDEILRAHGFEENEDPDARWRDRPLRGD